MNKGFNKKVITYEDVAYVCRELEEGCGAAVACHVQPSSTVILCTMMVTWKDSITPQVPPLTMTRRVFLREGIDVPKVLYQWGWAAYQHFNVSVLDDGRSAYPDPFNDIVR